MRKLLSFFLFLCLLHACSSIYFGEDKPPKAVKIPENYAPKNDDSALRNRLVLQAKKLIGSKYKYGGTSPKGFDCSGFTGYVYDKINIDISRSSLSQSKKGKPIKIKETKKGDLIFFAITKKQKISHVALVVSNDSKGLVVVHSTTSRGVRKDNISHSAYWKPKILFARQIVE